MHTTDSPSGTLYHVQHTIYPWSCVACCKTVANGTCARAPKSCMHREATAREFGRSQAAEEAGEGTRVDKRVGLLAAQESGLVPDGVVNGSRRAGW